MELTIFLMIGPWQYIIIGVVILLMFGGKKIPELMKGLGSGIKEFKDASKEDEEPSKVEEKHARPESGNVENTERSK